MVPFRAFVGDLLPQEQRTKGFAMQSMMLGLGAVSASALPWILSNALHLSNVSSPGRKIPLTVEVSFYVGGGIVADSDPAAEYEETKVKAQAMEMALARAFKGQQ